jgi:hypothetical protein
MHEHLPLVESMHSSTITADSLPKNMGNFRNCRGQELGDGIVSFLHSYSQHQLQQTPPPGKHFGNFIKKEYNIELSFGLNTHIV